MRIAISGIEYDDVISNGGGQSGLIKVLKLPNVVEKSFCNDNGFISALCRCTAN